MPTLVRTLTRIWTVPVPGAVMTASVVTRVATAPAPTPAALATAACIASMAAGVYTLGSP